MLPYSARRKVISKPNRRDILIRSVSYTSTLLSPRATRLLTGSYARARSHARTVCILYANTGFAAFRPFLGLIDSFLDRADGAEASLCAARSLTRSFARRRNVEEIPPRSRGLYLRRRSSSAGGASPGAHLWGPRNICCYSAFTVVNIAS